MKETKFYNKPIVWSIFNLIVALLATASTILLCLNIYYFLQKTIKMIDYYKDVIQLFESFKGNIGSLTPTEHQDLVTSLNAISPNLISTNATPQALSDMFKGKESIKLLTTIVQLISENPIELKALNAGQELSGVQVSSVKALYEFINEFSKYVDLNSLSKGDLSQMKILSLISILVKSVWQWFIIFLIMWSVSVSSSVMLKISRKSAEIKGGVGLVVSSLMYPLLGFIICPLLSITYLFRKKESI